MSIILHISYCYTAQNLSGNVQSVQLLNIDVYNSDICYHLKCSFKKQFTEKSISKTSHVFKKKVIFLCHWNIICLRIYGGKQQASRKNCFQVPTNYPNHFFGCSSDISLSKYSQNKNKSDLCLLIKQYFIITKMKNEFKRK